MGSVGGLWWDHERSCLDKKLLEPTSICQNHYEAPLVHEVGEGKGRGEGRKLAALVAQLTIRGRG